MKMWFGSTIRSTLTVSATAALVRFPAAGLGPDIERIGNAQAVEEFAGKAIDAQVAMRVAEACASAAEAVADAARADLRAVLAGQALQQVQPVAG